MFRAMIFVVAVVLVSNIEHKTHKCEVKLIWLHTKANRWKITLQQDSWMQIKKDGLNKKYI